MQSCLNGLESFVVVKKSERSSAMKPDVVYVTGMPLRRIKVAGTSYFVCHDIMTACGYSTTGVAGQFRDYPSYRLIHLSQQRTPVAVVEHSHVVEWLRYKRKAFVHRGSDTGSILLEKFVSDWLRSMTCGITSFIPALNVDTDEHDSVVALAESPIETHVELPAEIPAESHGESLVEPTSDMSLEKWGEYTDFDRYMSIIETEMDKCMQDLIRCRAEIDKRKKRYAGRIAELKAGLAEMERLV